MQEQYIIDFFFSAKQETLQMNKNVLSQLVSFSVR